jgi:hypothetical protein
MNTSQDPSFYVIMAMITIGILSGFALSAFFEPEASPFDCVLQKPTVEDVPEGEDDGEEDEEDGEEGGDEDEKDEDEKDEDEEHINYETLDTDEEDRIVGRKVNRIFVETIDSILEIRKARESRMAKRLKVE